MNNQDASSSDVTAVASRRKTEWWLLTGGAMESAVTKLYSGPYTTREDAIVARVAIERLRGANDLWVDSRKAPDAAG